MTKKKSINIKDYIDDDAIDLSLCDLQEVPVKEIASCPRATNVDLSNNKLTVLGNNFGVSLTHLVKLDLSGNQLIELPDSFGLLVNLKHLDLYKNKLQTLPPSFANLRSLRWLDLKENPLIPRVAQVAGTCLDQVECMAAARKVVKFMAQLQEEIAEENRRKEQERLEQLMIAELKAQKKELKLKRKKNKKNAAKNAENLNNEALNGAVVEEVAAIEPVLYPVDEPVLKPPFFERLKDAAFWLMKIITILALVAGLALFGLSFVDEKSFSACANFLNKHITFLNVSAPAFPLDFRSAIFLALDVLKSTISSTAALTALAFKILKQFYSEVLASESTWLVLRTIGNHALLLYTTGTQLLVTAYQQLAALIQSYIS